MTAGMVSERTTTVEQVNLATCLAEVELFVQISWQQSFQLKFRTSSDLPVVKCDPLALQNALLNLLFNARDAMPSGGVISVSAEAAWFDSAAWVELRVADRGIGMKPDTIIRAFDPFFTTKSDGLGGAGLPMVERFVQDAGGRIHIESEYGVGTTVKVQLPGSLISAAHTGPIQE